MIKNILPYVIVFLSTLICTLILTPIVREVHRHWGMVDKPDPRRINKIPIPRGGGMAIVLGYLIPYFVYHLVTGEPLIYGIDNQTSYVLCGLGVGIALLGLVDDRFSLPPKLKLLGQVVIAVSFWVFTDFGFFDIWPSIPSWLDCILTVAWVIGAVNAFNLIDGLDGLASGLALIATIGMAGSLFFMQNTHGILVYCALAGALLGFLRYNYNPASIFLGDCGSMFIGFTLAVLPFTSHDHNSLLVSIGVPLLAMGVPIFDTSLAIIRRSIRRLLAKGGDKFEGAESSAVMTADADHLHHRILRATGFDQRKTAWMLYTLALAAVAIGLIAMALKSRAGGFWLAAVTLAAIVIFKDARIEFFDAGRLLNDVARSQDRGTRRRFATLSLPFYVFFDLIVLFGVFVLCVFIGKGSLGSDSFRTWMPIRLISTFVFLVVFKTYRTVWSRALISNYIRLFLGCVFGAITGSIVAYYWPSISSDSLVIFTVMFALMSFVALVFVRMLWSIVRDLVYAINCSQIRYRKDVSRILVYGSGLRYRAFRRELVRSAARNNRLIVGFIDDDVYLKGRYIGGVKIYGTINNAPEIINELNVDSVVIACEMTDEWLNVVKKILSPTGVKVTRFSYTETPIC